MNSMLEVLAGYAESQPEKLCIVDAEGEHTYAQVWKRTREIAGVLSAMGIGFEDPVLTECTQDARFLVCNFACEMIGAMFVPIEHKASAERVQAIYEETQSVLFIHEADYETGSRKITFDELFAMPCDMPVSQVVFPDGDALAEILFTTGTTGKSKGIEVMHKNNIAIAENICYGVEMKPDNVELLPLPLSHSHGLRCFYANLFLGATVVLMEGVMNVRRVFELLDRYHVTAMDISPSAALVLMRLSKGALADYDSRLEYIQIGTAALPDETKEKLIALLPDVRLYNFYGSTESGRTCVLNFNDGHNRSNCIGRPTKNATFIVTDDDRNEICSSSDNMGLIATAGAMNMRGYYKQPELSAEIMKNGFIYTNDLGYIDEEGYVYVVGRKDDIINFKGIKIAPEEIEESVRKYKDVVDCACVPKPDADFGQVPKLFVSVKDKESFSKKDLYAFLTTCIDGNKMPKEIEVIDEIPRTYNGKIQRMKLLNG